MPREQPTFRKDFQLGMQAEKSFVQKVKAKYDITLNKLPNNHFADFLIENKDIMIELKRRNNVKNRYPATNIGYDKVLRFNKFNNANNEKFKFIMVFHFNDGIFFFIHNKNYKYDIRKYVRRKRADYDDKVKDYIFIPVTELIPLERLPEYVNPPKIMVRYNI